jgi:uncharacterized RDD family membrane protein YckC
MKTEELGDEEGVSSGAGFWARALARAIDIGFGYVLALFAGVLGAFVLMAMESAGAVPPGWHQRVKDLSVPAVGLAMVGAVFYHSFCEGLCGASLGKLVCRLRVVRQDGGPSTVGRAFIRSVAWFVDALFLGVTAYMCMERSALNQRYGDIWGKTVVVEKDKLFESDPQPKRRMLTGLALGSAIWTAALTAGIVLSAL